MQLFSYLNFSGNCEAAFDFCVKTLGGKITFMMRQGESPMGDKVPAEMKNKIVYATLEVPGRGVLMGADHPHGKKVTPAGFCVSQQVKDSPDKGFCRKLTSLPLFLPDSCLKAGSSS